MRVNFAKSVYNDSWHYDVICDRCEKVVGFGAGAKCEQTTDICKECALDLYMKEKMNSGKA